jgi:hypothetical protein
MSTLEGRRGTYTRRHDDKATCLRVEVKTCCRIYFRSYRA